MKNEIKRNLWAMLYIACFWLSIFEAYTLRGYWRVIWLIPYCICAVHVGTLMSYKIRYYRLLKRTKAFIREVEGDKE